MNEELKIIISAEVEKFKQNIEKAKSQVKGFQEQVKKASANVDQKFAEMGKAISGGIKKAATALAALGTAVLALGASTAEYRAEQAKLIAAFKTVGGSAEQAKKTYNDLYRVLGDTGSAVEAAQQLSNITQEESKLAEYTNIVQGVFAKWGTAIDSAGFAEGINHTIQLGEVQGTLADALEFSGISVDSFNEQLAQCATTEEREKLIRETLNGLYSEAAANYEKTNAEVLAQNEAQAKLQVQTASLGKAVAPVVAAFTNFGANALAVVVPYIKELAEKLIPVLTGLLDGLASSLEVAFGWIAEHKAILAVMAGIITGIVTAIGLYNAVAAIKATMAALEVTTVWGLVAAYTAQAAAMIVALAPYLLIVAAIAAVVAAFVVLWNKCDWFRDFWKGLWEDLKNLFSAFVESLKPLWDAIVGVFQEAWEIIKIIWDVVKPYFEGIWGGIKAVFSVVGAVLGGAFKVAWEAIKAVWSVVVGFFTAIWETIKGIFSVVKNVLSGNFKGAWEAIKGIFSGWGAFFKGLWDTIVNLFKNIAITVGNTVGNVVKAAINGVLSVAVGLINGFISAINLAIGIINAIPGVNIKKIGKLETPKLARGGIVDSATLAVIGEQGKEAVVPLENNLEWLDKLATMLNERMGSGNAPIVLEIDGKAFAEVSVNSINQLTKQRGSLPLRLV